MEHFQTFIPRYFIVHPVGDRFKKYENLITLYLYAVQAFIIYFGDIFREASFWAGTPYVTPKTVEQQDIQSLLRIRSNYVEVRT